MGDLLQRILQNYPYIFALALFGIGTFTVLTHSNLLKKVIGINIMEGSTYLFFIAAGNIRGGVAPIKDMVSQGDVVYVNPLPQALMLTGIVVSVSVTALSLALIMRLYKLYGTIDAKEIHRIRKEVRANGNSNQR